MPSPERTADAHERRVASLRERADAATGIDRALLLVELGEELAARRPARALAPATEALALLEQPEAPSLAELERFAADAPDARARVAALLQSTGANEEALRVASALLDELPEDATLTRARALRTLGRLRYRREDSRGALDFLLEALDLVRDEDGPEARGLRTHVLIDLCRCRYSLGETERAEERAREALARALEDDDRPAAASCEVNLGNVRWQLGDLGGALQHYRAAMRVQRETGALQELALSLHNVACVHYETNDNEATLETVDDALRSRDELVGNHVLPRLLLLRGRTLLETGRPREAARAMQESHAEQERLGNPGGAANAAAALADVETRLGDTEAAGAWIERALRDVEETHDELSRARCFVGLARAELGLGRPRRALEHLDRLRVAGDDTRSRRVRVDAELCASQALEALGDHAAALDRFREGSALERELELESSRARAERLKMLHRIEQGRHREELLAVSRDELERRVAERTAELEAKRAALVDSDASRATLEAQLRHSQQMEAIGRLAGGVAHDFNNLLVVIQGYGERMLHASEPSDPGWEAASQILGASTRASRLTSQLLSFSRRDAYREEVRDLGALVAGMEHMLGRLIGEDVELVVTVPPRPAEVLGDPGRFEQLVLDLVVHARDTLPGGGRLELAVDERPPDTVALSVEHDGEPTAEDADSPVLADARAIVERAGGELRVDSGGRRVEVRLPRHALRKECAGDDGGGAGRVLLVEDDEGVRALVSDDLRALGYHVDVARNGREALRLAQSDARPWDLVVCDVVMPELDGPSLFRAMRDEGRDEPFLFASGYTDRAQAFLAQHADELEFLAKPFPLRRLEERVAELVDRRRAERAGTTQKGGEP